MENHLPDYNIHRVMPVNQNHTEILNLPGTVCAPKPEELNPPIFLG